MRSVIADRFGARRGARQPSSLNPICPAKRRSCGVFHADPRLSSLGRYNLTLWINQNSRHDIDLVDMRPAQITIREIYMSITWLLQLLNIFLSSWDVEYTILVGGHALQSCAIISNDVAAELSNKGDSWSSDLLHDRTFLFKLMTILCTIAKCSILSYLLRSIQPRDWPTCPAGPIHFPMPFCNRAFTTSAYHKLWSSPISPAYGLRSHSFDHLISSAVLLDLQRHELLTPNICISKITFEGHHYVLVCKICDWTIGKIELLPPL